MLPAGAPSSTSSPRECVPTRARLPGSAACVHTPAFFTAVSTALCAPKSAAFQDPRPALLEAWFLARPAAAAAVGAGLQVGPSVDLRAGIAAGEDAAAGGGNGSPY